MAWIEKEKLMTNKSIETQVDYKIHPNFLTAEEKRQEVGELISMALKRLFGKQEAGETNGS